MAKEGSTIGGLMDAFGTSVSMSLQYGVPLEDYVRKFSHMRFEPQGYTKNPDIRIAKSLIDYIFRWMGTRSCRLQGSQPWASSRSERQSRRRSAGPTTAESFRAAARRPAGESNRTLSPRKTTSETESAASRKSSRQAAAVSPRLRRGFRPIKPQAKTNGQPTVTQTATRMAMQTATANGEISTALLARAGMMLKDAGPNTARSEQFADFQSDAPACDNCGTITVRAGNCYLCHNCGSSMGCS